MTRIEEKNKDKPQIYADKMGFLRSAHGILISSKQMVSFMVLPSLLAANGMITVEKSMAESCTNWDRSRFYLRQSAFIRVHSRSRLFCFSFGSFHVVT